LFIYGKSVSLYLKVDCLIRSIKAYWHFNKTTLHIIIKAKKHAKLLNFMQIASNIVSLRPVKFKR